MLLPVEALRQVRGKLQVELSPRLADILDLTRLASGEQIAARVAALDHKPPPRQAATCELLAAVALLGDDLVDEFRWANDPALLMIGPAGYEMVEELLDKVGPVSERELAEDLALTDAEFLAVPGYVASHAAEAVRTTLGGVLEGIIVEAYSRGWLSGAPTFPQDDRDNLGQLGLLGLLGCALAKLSKRRAKTIGVSLSRSEDRADDDDPGG